MPYTRNLTVTSDNIGTYLTLLFTFGPSDIVSGQSKACPVVWRVGEFHPDGDWSIDMTYTSEHAFIKPIVKDGVIVNAASSVSIEDNYETTLSIQRGQTIFTEPTKGGVANAITAINMTGSTQDLAAGFMLDGTPTPMYYIPSLNDEDSVGLGLQPTLRVYVDDTYSYGDGSILDPDNPSWLTPFWEINLAELDESTNWSVTLDSSRRLVIIKV